MTQYKLTYFDITGLGEPIRFLMAYGDIKYEDKRLSFESFGEIKPTLPFGQVPILEFDGHTITQSVAICRYLARKTGLYGANAFDDLLVDETIDHINDLRVKLSGLRFELDEVVKAKKLEDLKTNVIPYYMKRFNDKIGTSGYFVLGRLTLADVYFAALNGAFKFMISPDFLDAYPNVQKVVDNVFNEPKIKQWIEKRPKTSF